MSFLSINFVLFFSLLFVLHFSIPHRYRWMLLLLASYFFYGSVNILFIPVLFVPGTIIFFLSRNIGNAINVEKRKIFLYTGLIVSIGILVFFKYFDFFGNTIHSIITLFRKTGPYSPANIIFPIGISFFTFKTVSYLIDLYHKRIKREKHLGYFLLYISFFPQILAGPIDRAVKFIPELRKKTSLDIDRIIKGGKQVIWGIFKKAVIADRLAVFVNNVFQNPEGQGINLIFAAYFFSFQIYCDFSGYSDIAIGISRILGYRSMDNFNFPYFSKNISEFWNRWHISLSTWLRDYLFLPIAYLIMGKFKGDKILMVKTESWAYITGMSITMFLGGLWHGAGWTFILWGVLHGFFLIFSHLTKKRRKKLLKLVKIHKIPRIKNGIKILITFHLVTAAWIFFRSPGIKDAWLYIKNINFSFNETGPGYLIFNVLMLTIFIIMEFILKNKSVINRRVKVPVVIQTIAYALFICIIIIFFVDQSREFIYFGF